MTYQPGANRILSCSQDDVNFKSALKQISNDVLRECLQKETRKGALRQLRAEAMRRGLEI